MLGPAVAAFLITGLNEGRLGVTAFAKRLVLVSRFLIYSLSPVMFLALAIVVGLAMRAPLPPLSEFAIYSGLPPLGLPAVLLLVLFFNGFGEETGWRGFALEHGGRIPRGCSSSVHSDRGAEPPSPLGHKHSNGARRRLYWECP